MTANPRHAEDARSHTATRRSLLAGGASLAALVLFGGGSAKVADAAASTPRPRFRQLKLEFLLDPRTIDSIRPVPAGGFPTGPFYLAGPLFPQGSIDSASGKPKPGASPEGTFHSSGWIYDPNGPFAIVAHLFELIGKGTIEAQGLGHDPGVRAITGGTGRFLGVRGELSTSAIKPPFAALFTLTLV